MNQYKYIKQKQQMKMEVSIINFILILRIANSLLILSKNLVFLEINTLTNSRMYYPFNKSMKKV